MILLKLKRLISFIALILCFVATAQAQNENISVISETRWHKTPIENAYMNGRIADAAIKYKDFAPIPRIAFYDIGYPKDKAEFEALNGYGILLVAAMSQDEIELPIKRAYIVTNGKEYDLINLKKLFIMNPDLNSQIVKTFGKYRVDSLFLFPVYLRYQVAELFVDFTENRTGMKLASFEGSVPENIKQLPATKPQDGKKNDDAIQLFIKREYPGYADR